MTTDTDAHVLLVDDDPMLRRATARALVACGFRVSQAENGAEALRMIGMGSVDTIVTDIHMPEMDGLSFLRAIRQQDSDVPVVLMTGEPSLETAIAAIEHGATQYLLKPLDADTLLKGIHRAVRLGALARARRTAVETLASTGASSGNHPTLNEVFDRAVSLIWPAFQPIVAWPEGRVYAYEALLRSRDLGFSGPLAILEAAERLRRVHEVGRRMRASVAEAMPALDPSILVFVNLHPRDLLDDDLFSPDAPLSRHAPRVVLEMTERAALHGLGDIPGKVRRLRALGFRIAVDDLGAGYAGLSSVLQLEPDVVKLDMSLVRGIDAEAARQSVVRSMTNLCRELGMNVVAEGVETQGERDALGDIGCPLLQGYWFAPPGPAFPGIRT